MDHQAIRTRVKQNAAAISYNDRAPALVTKALKADEGRLTANGALAVTTGIFTGRSVKDKFIVNDELSRDNVWWDNSFSMSEAHFDALLDDMLDYMKGKSLYAQELFAGADLSRQMSVTVFTETAWHAMFIRNLLIRPE